jgi:hypothetical protein
VTVPDGEPIDRPKSASKGGKRGILHGRRAEFWTQVPDSLTLFDLICIQAHDLFLTH